MHRVGLVCSLLIFIGNCYAYTKGDIKLTNQEFITRVKPQLNNINQDYQSLLSLLSPSLKRYKGIFNHFAKIKSKEPRFISYCQKLANPNCSEIINEYLDHLNAILQDLNTSPTPKDLEHHPMDQIIISFDEFQKIRTQILDLYMQLFHFNFFYQAEIKSHMGANEFNKLISKAYNQFNIFMIKSSDERFQEQFLSFWNGFIKPLSFYVMSDNEKTTFLSKLNDYNLRWNILNVELTKRNKTIPKQAQTLLIIMHNRWNNILKVTLR